jgi:hypothetical protein
MSSMLVVDRPLLFPGVNVDNTQDGPCVDTRFTLPHDEHVYLSRRTIRDAAATGILSERDIEDLATVYGFLPAGERDALEHKLLERDAEIIGLQTRIADLQVVENAIARAAGKWGDE